MQLANKFILIAATGLSAAVPGLAQSVQEVLPPAASPGTEIVLVGTNLDGTAAVRFRYQDSVSSGSSGSSIAYTVAAIPTSVSAERVRVVVPDIPNSTSFASGFDPLGSVAAIASNGTAAGRAFYFLEVENGVVETVGQGTPQSNGLGQAYTTFAPSGASGDLPFQGFPIGLPTERIELRNATPGATARLYFGLYDPALPIEFGGGSLAVSRARFIDFGGAVVGPDGTAGLDVSIPGAGLIGVDVAFQWLVLDAGASSAGIALAQGLKVRI